MSVRKTRKKNNNKKISRKKNQYENPIPKLVGAFFLSLIIILSIYTDSNGIILVYLKKIIESLFGMGAFVFPFIIMAMILLYYFDKENYKRNFLSTLFIFAAILVILDVILSNDYYKNMGFFERINYSSEIGQAGFGGGIFGIIFSFFLLKLFGKKATLILAFSSISIFLIILLNKNIIDLFRSFREALLRIPKITKNINSFLDEKIRALSYSLKLRREVKNLERKKKIEELQIERKKNKQKDNKNKIEKITTKSPTINGLKTENKKEYIYKEFEIEVASSNKTEENVPSKKTKKIEDFIDEAVRKENNNFLEKAYEKPSIQILSDEVDTETDEEDYILENAQKLVETLSNFGIKAKVNSVNVGPSITKYEIQIAPGIKVSRILNLSSDIALSLASSDIRIEAPIPGKSAIGIEIPNKHRTGVRIRQIIQSEEFKSFKGDIPVALGKDIEGRPVIADIEKMPHLLIAGATGSGKSVCINTIITSIVYKSSPEEVKLILIDPKVVELSIYNGIPHLYIPVVTNPNKAAGALNWAVTEMNRRYENFANAGVRDIKGYNKKQKENKLPKIVMIIDELSDLMMATSSNEVEELICRIAQMARAAGIYLIIATQRPSVDVITGTIKANIPSRISFAVSSQTDSRTILDMGGAEKLLGRGDMLYSPQGITKPLRVQGAYIEDNEVERLVEYLKSKNETEYEKKIIEDIEKKVEISDGECDELLYSAIDIVLAEQQASTSFLQRRLKIGYARAARIIDQMAERGIVGPQEGNKGRRVLVTREDIDERG